MFVQLTFPNGDFSVGRNGVTPLQNDSDRAIHTARSLGNVRPKTMPDLPGVTNQRRSAQQKSRNLWERRIQHDATSFNEYASSYSLLFWGAFLMPGICAIWIHLDSVCFLGFVVRPSNAELRQLHMLNGPDMDKSNVQQGIPLGSFRQSRNVFFRILHVFLCFSQWCLRCGNACIWSSTMRQPLPRLLQRFWGHPMPVVCDSCRLK